MSEGPVGIANGTDWRAKSRPGGSVLHGLVTVLEKQCRNAKLICYPLSQKAIMKNLFFISCFHIYAVFVMPGKPQGCSNQPGSGGP
jgi:hypothetical protein